MDKDLLKRELETLQRDFQDNIGMAGFIFGRPVELLPEPDRDRMINGFCTEANVTVFVESKSKFEAASQYDFTEVEQERIAEAISILDRFIPLLKQCVASEIGVGEFRNKVRQIFAKPLPEGEENCMSEMSRLVGIVHFLAGEKLGEKDNWDRMIDCSQMHDVLTRMGTVCGILQTSIVDSSSEMGGALKLTLDLSKNHLENVESFFKGNIEPGDLQTHFQELSEEMGKLWGDE